MLKFIKADIILSMGRFYNGMDQVKKEGFNPIDSSTLPENLENNSGDQLQPEETFLGSVRFKNPSELSPEPEEEKDLKPFNPDKVQQIEIPNENQFDKKVVSNLLHYIEGLNRRDETRLFLFDVSMVSSYEELKEKIDSASENNIISDEEKKEIYKIIGQEYINNKETGSDLKPGDKVTFFGGSNVYTVKNLQRTDNDIFVLVEEMKVPLSIKAIHKVPEDKREFNINTDAGQYPAVKLEEEEKDAENQFDGDKLQQFEIPNPDEETKESKREFDPWKHAGEYMVPEIKEREGKSLKDVRNNILDYLDSNVSREGFNKAFHNGIEWAESIAEIKREIDSALKYGVINPEQKDLLYHLAGLTENEQFNKLSQFKIPVLSEEDTKESVRGFDKDETLESRRPFEDQDIVEGKREFDPMSHRIEYPAVKLEEEEKDAENQFDGDKLQQFEIPTQKDISEGPKDNSFVEEETFEQMYERAKNKAEEEEKTSNQISLNNLRDSVSGERKINEEPRSDYNLEIFVPGINRAPYKVGDEVSVIRTSGQMDSGWNIADIREGKVYLIKEHESGQLMRKKVTAKDFIKEQILANKNNIDANEFNDFVDNDIAREAGLNDEEIAYIKRGTKSGGLLTMSWQEIQKFNRLYDKYYDFKQKVENEKPLPPPPAPENAKGIEVDNFEELFAKAEEIDKNLEKAREEYASAYINFKNEHRSKKNKFAKVMADLGMDKQMPNSDQRPEELKELERAYIEAQKEKSRYLFKESVKKEKVVGLNTITAKVEEVWANEGLVKAMEEEYERFNRQIQESLPRLEKGILGKSLEKWQKLSLPTRIALSTAFMTGVVLASGATAAAALGYAGMRATRAGASVGAGQLVGKGIQGRFDKSNKERKENFLEEYGENITEENFSEKTKKAREFFESEKERKNRQMLGKAVAMAGVAGGAGILSSIDSIGLGNGGSVSENIPSSKPGVVAENIPKPTTPDVPKVENIEVGLSSKGFIKTFDDMKTKLLEKYGSVDKVPDNLKHFTQTSSMDLAKEFGMYDPEHNLSGSGLKGESLSLDDKGNLKYEHLDGREDILFDAKRGEAYEFDGKLINSEGEVVPKEYVGKTAPFESDISNKNTGASVAEPENVSKPNSNNLFEIKGKPFAFPENFEYKGHKLSIGDMEGRKVLVFDGQAVAESVSNPDQSFYPMVLAEKLQEGSGYREIREAYVAAQEEMTKGYRNFLARFPFEGGVLHVLPDLDNNGSVRVALNGKEIAKGIINQDKIEVLLNKELKGGWFSADTVYERAIKSANENKVFDTIKTLLAQK